MTNYELLSSGKLPKPECAETLKTQLISYCLDSMAIEIAFQLGKEFTNPSGSIQGGFLCAMLDECLGSVLFYSLDEGQIAPTLELHTQFLKGAKPGSFVGKARVISKGRQVCFIAGELFQDDRLISKSSATAIIK